ncbi:epidermal growth factor receptor kinase substrate 8-like protein 3 [Myripristis murdjan]|uniref:epidermal growth factor receptor kinase substrate 8-like protein 3 n=1 Tax=Myripristis murdjan TaxID=586833 RepID=UPI0011763E5F|nr:epidermal growth factor receptor kinase substrate 8-like protein 3 [Myripristis murdjan]
MFRSNSPIGYDTSSYTGSIQSNGFSTTDDISSQASSLLRPSAKSIYLQRKEYAVSINKMMDKFQYRVEHLFTCDLDGKELKNVGDCVERLKLLDSMGRVWGQVMLLEVRGATLLLTDVETKEVLESMALSAVVELTAVLDSGVYNSLLTVSVQDRSKKATSVFMFQCEDVRADYIKKDLSRAVSRKQVDPSINSNQGNLAGREMIKNVRNAAPPPEPRALKPPGDPVPRWSAPDYEEDDDDLPTPVLVLPPREVPFPRRETPPPTPSTIEEEPLPPPRPYTELDRNVDILNHIFNDLEIFMGRIAAVVAKDEKKNKKKKKKGKAIDGMPSRDEFATCLQKIKCGFNLLGELNGEISNPSAPEFVHCLFSSLGFVVSHCPEDLPPTIVAPLLTPECIRLLSEEANTEEDQLWQSLGDPWNIPSTKWPEDDEDIPTYTLEFFDGWQPPEAGQAREPVCSWESQRSAPNKVNPHRRLMTHTVADGCSSAQWTPPPARYVRPGEPSICMRVMYDFSARNHRELSITKGEVVELLDKTKQWWKVRNSRGEEGFVPNNILEPLDKEPDEQSDSCPDLTKRSKPAEVRAWLEFKGFSKITVRCLGPLSGSMLLGMTREELKTVCPEEGGRVFFQLQAVKSAMAVSDRPRGLTPCVTTASLLNHDQTY